MQLGGDDIQENDALKIYRGDDYIINEKIKIHQPTLGEITLWGEQKYFSFIHSFTSTPTDLKYQLSLMNIDWNTISDYELFMTIYKTFDKSRSEIVFGDIDFQKFKPMIRNNEELVLYDKDSGIIIDRSIYEIAISYLRKTHNLKKNVEKAMNETTKTVLLEEAKEQFEMAQKETSHSYLLPLISTMINMEGFKCNWTTVWDMKINAFMDAVEQILHIKNVDLLLNSGYSGFGVDLKKINKKELNYFSKSGES